MKSFLATLQSAFACWNANDAPRLGAALAFYTILSLSPLVILVIGIAALVFSHSSVQGQILHEIQSMVGSQGKQAVETLLINAQKPASGLIGTTLGVLSLLFGASGVCGELRSSLNTLWGVKSEGSSGIWAMMRERFFSFGMVLSIGFLLMVSLVLSTGLAAVGKYFEGFVPVPTSLLMIFNFLFSFAGTAILFALIFRFVPAAKISWREVWPGALLTAFLFDLGKFAIGLYLGRSSLASPYGAAGSVIVVIVWVYYSAQLFFFGAAFTHAYSENLTRQTPAAELRSTQEAA